MHNRGKRLVIALVASIMALGALVGAGARSGAPEADAAVLPSGFNVSTVFSGLTLPTAFSFAPDGRVFVAEKDGVVKVFTNTNDTSATVFADLRTEVLSYVDRGLLGLAIDPQWPTRPYVYVMYAYDHVLGDPAPPPKWNDTCAGTGSGVQNGNCTASARVSRLTAAADLEHMVPGSETVLVEDWCQQFAIHINGAIAFGSDGALYASHGTAASAHFTDYGQTGTPLNPCGDPPVPVGGQQTIPNAEGGSLRAQDPLTPGDPYTLDGTVIRIDPDTGAGLPGNPLFTSADANARRIVAFGLRMPFRFTVRPGTNELWVGDVGEDLREEIDRIPVGGGLPNAGWPCYEAELVNTAYQPLTMCQNLTAAGPSAVLAPYWYYRHNQPAFAGDTCATGSSSVSGLAFYPGGAYPTRYDNALIVADYARRCVWAMLPGADGQPDPSKVEVLMQDQRGATDLKIGPGGDVYLNDIAGGTIQKLTYTGANRAPIATITADRTNGPAPLTVHFDARSSQDPDGDPLHYEWDLDGDGAYDDSTSATPQFTYAAGEYDVRLRALDDKNLGGTTTVRITSGNSAPILAIEKPTSALQWAVGDTIQFSAAALDIEDGVLPGTSFDWDLRFEHCPGSCHEHFIGSWSGVKGASFLTTGHEYPSYLLLTVTARDSAGLTSTASVSLYPKVATVSFVSHPPGMTINARGAAKAPFSRDVIQGDLLSITAADQVVNGLPYEFDGWLDLGPASRDLVVNANRTMDAFFSVRRLRVPDRVVSEPGTTTTVDVPVSLSQTSKNTITAQYVVVGGTAGPDDVVLGTGSVSIPPGSFGTTVPVTLKPDTIVEPTEHFYLWFHDPTKAAFADWLGEVQILDDDGPTSYTYLPGLDGPTADLMQFAAIKLGVAPRDVPKIGGDLMRYIAAITPGELPQLTPVPEGSYRYAATYDRPGRDSVLAAATRYGVNGTQMHIIGTKLLIYLALLPPAP